MSSTTVKRSGVDRFLSFIEKVGNALPHPATLFALFALLVIVLSWLFSLTGISAIHPGTGETVVPVNLMSVEGLHLILTKMVTNFTAFAPLGTVLVALLGIGIAEGSGLIGTVLRMVVLAAPARLLTFVIVFAGVLTSILIFAGGFPVLKKRLPASDLADPKAPKDAAPVAAELPPEKLAPVAALAGVSADATTVDPGVVPEIPLVGPSDE